MDRHQQMYSTVVHHNGQDYRNFLRQRVGSALKSRRREFIDRLRRIHSSTTSSRNPLDSTTDGCHQLMEERRHLLYSLLDDSEKEHLDLETLLHLQDQVLLEFENDISCITGSSSGMEIDEITCPLCSIGKLVLYGTVLCCSCGLRLDTQTDSISLASIGRSIREAETMHVHSGCSQPLRGSLMEQKTSVFGESLNSDSVSLLCLECPRCSFLEIVI
ncbi:hypothetical protein X801_03381 [Opisthorchis viverrini]|uniref:Uncharacterized protein n=2 Tax=Opisthorchis viverrini TaxID=6198 RepID=A0A1S8X1Z2_OPIVI|nr:hypothetical protein T265_05760 [Opisthorchis viverrini]KER27147.1 hypothetical protein T265_05760 [Opisthorchis viverrini]OON20730.1 hypothetical protein X801_03381 [Opisthorchis viverrini]